MGNMTDQDKKDVIERADKDAALQDFLIDNGVSYFLAEAFAWKDEEKFCDDVSEYTDGEIEVLFSALAKKYTDGHYTIFRFTTGYKALFSTTHVQYGDDNYYTLFGKPTFKTIREAMLSAIAESSKVYV